MQFVWWKHDKQDTYRKIRSVPLLDFNTTITFEAGKHADFPFRVYANRTDVTAETLTFIYIVTKQYIW